ncbi:MAG: ASKHA domain-containing protein [Candidatus Bathyarchaeota archaeon]|jgi:uncharacterized 2Fe-2S/4Fe-4S cluster protein (DUF4445 family)
MSDLIVIFEPSGKKTKLLPGTTVLEASQATGILIDSECGGRGSCGKCKIIVLSGATNPQTPEETRHLTSKEFDEGWRLACCVRVKSDMVVMIPRSQRERKFQTRGIEWEYPHAPLTNKISELEGVSSDQYGIAVDIGTSKVVGHLVNLKEGKVVGVASVENPQVVHGEDVMSRLTFALQGAEERRKLHSLSIQAFESVLRILCSEAGIDYFDVMGAVVVGNTLMHHLFLDLEIETLSRAPFAPAMVKSYVTPPSELGVTINHSGLVYLPPVIAGFVGSDALADLVATRIQDWEDPVALVDIGTNTEVFVGDGERMTCCSCASGPAFEGGHTSIGVKAVAGAIERLRIEPETLDVEYETIGGEEPIGLCGSGMIDALAELWKQGILDGFGRLSMDDSTLLIREGEGGLEFVVERGDRTASGKDIALTSGDIQELLLAKAAIYSAFSVMLMRQGLRAEDLSTIYVAGAFGELLDTVNSMVIGMLPDVDPERILFVGNTAVMGAKAMLVSEEAWMTAERLRDRVRYHELSLDPAFDSEFLDALFLPHRKPERFPKAVKLRRN